MVFANISKLIYIQMIRKAITSWKQFVPCDNCKKHSSKTVPGFIPSAKGLIECECHKNWQSTFIKRQKFIAYGFRDSYYDFNIEDYKGTKSKLTIERIKTYVKKFPIDDRVKKMPLYFYGANGTQKTLVASWIGKMLISKNYNVSYVLMNDLIKALLHANEYENNESKIKAEQLLNKIDSSDLVVVDEAFDKEKMLTFKSGYHNSFIDSWIRDRLTSDRGVIFISNVDISMISANGFSKSIEDLIKRETTLYNSFLIFQDNFIQMSESNKLAELMGILND